MTAIQELSGPQLTHILQPYSSLPCVNGKLYLGSMFYLDFGRAFPSTTAKGAAVELYEMTLSIRDVAWNCFKGNQLLVDATSANKELFALMLRELTGRSIQSVTSLAEIIKINFDRELFLEIDITNQFGTDSDILEIALPNGSIVALGKAGELLSDVGFDMRRANYWNIEDREI